MSLETIIASFSAVIEAAIILSLILAPNSPINGVIGASSKFVFNTINAAKSYPGTGSPAFAG